MIDQGQYGDTQYYLITSERLPILLPLQTAGVPSAALALPDAILRVWIEDAYVRDQSPGEHVQFQLIPIGDPIGLIGNTLGAIPVGIDDTFQQATGPGSTLRPLGTADVYRPFGVGGPVYDKTTGDPTTDSNVLPFNGAKSSLAPQQSLQTQTESTQGEPDGKKLGNEETQQTNTPPEGTKPRPLQVLRDSLKFDTPKPPSATRPSGDGPLKKIVGAMTGQRPTAADAGDEPANDAA
jgi:PE-PPE domain